MFKRIVTLLTVTALFCSLLSIGFSANAVYEDDTVYGDIDGNGKVDTEDARLALKLASGVILLEDEAQLKRADVNFDGIVTVFDARQILRGVAGLATLQPSGAFRGFDGGGRFNDEQSMVKFFNNVLNRVKVVNGESKHIAATITKTENDELVDFNIKEVELPSFGFGTSAEGIADIVKEKLTKDDKKEATTLIPYGEEKFELMSVEGSDYVSDLKITDVYGARAAYDETLGEITVEIALPDTEMEMVTQSAYSRVCNASNMLAAQDSTLLKLIGTSKETAMFREFKNGILKVVVDIATENVLSYSITYESKTYISQANFGMSSLSVAKLKGIEYKKVHTIVYDDFQWPEK